MSDLFRSGAVTLHSGGRSTYLIDCAALTQNSWKTLADNLAARVPPFGTVTGVPRGGLPFAEALWGHCVCGACGGRRASHGAPGCCTDFVAHKDRLIVDDVCTTGKSLNDARDTAALQISVPTAIHGGVVFARGPWPEWVTPLYVDGDVLAGMLQNLREQIAQAVRRLGPANPWTRRPS